ncbi:hypothetical protein ACSBR1_031308 [Camellia fascicularis]
MMILELISSTFMKIFNGVSDSIFSILLVSSVISGGVLGNRVSMCFITRQCVVIAKARLEYILVTGE